MATNVGVLDLGFSGSGTIDNARLEALGGTFTTANLNVATHIGSFTLSPTGLGKTTATARFENADVNVSGNVQLAVTNRPSATVGSLVNGTLELVNSEMTVGGNVQAARNLGAAAIDATAVISLNPSFLDIAGNLLLGNGATLKFGIEGLTRPAPGMPGEYGAIDATSATLDGQLVLDFDFVGVQLGDVFELIRLDPAGMFTGFFDDTTIVGLPAGLTAEAAIIGESLFATVVMAAGVAGDYNGNGVVDTDDYTVWRDNLGLMITLPNEDPGTTPGQVTPEDYDFWKSRFGATSGNGSVSHATVPEPASGGLVVFGATLLAVRRSGRPEMLRRLSLGRGCFDRQRCDARQTVR
jgi:hypothetical protein